MRERLPSASRARGKGFRSHKEQSFPNLPSKDNLWISSKIMTPQ